MKRKNKQGICKRTLALFGMLFALIITSCAVIPDMQVQAAEKVNVTYKKDDGSKKCKGKSTINVKHYYKRAVLEGSSDSVKKINSYLKKKSDAFMKEKSGAVTQAQEDVANGMYDKETYQDFVSSKVTYNDKNVVSIKITQEWYAGGTANQTIYGYTFSLKSGKLLKLTDVCKGSSSQIKKNLVAKMKKGADAANIDFKTVNAYKTGKFQFYLKPDQKAVVCFEPYEISFGGDSRCYTIQSKYK